MAGLMIWRCLAGACRPARSCEASLNGSHQPVLEAPAELGPDQFVGPAVAAQVEGGADADVDLLADEQPQAGAGAEDVRVAAADRHGGQPPAVIRVRHQE